MSERYYQLGKTENTCTPTSQIPQNYLKKGENIDEQTKKIPTTIGPMNTHPMKQTVDAFESGLITPNTHSHWKVVMCGKCRISTDKYIGPDDGLDLSGKEEQQYFRSGLCKRCFIYNLYKEMGDERKRGD